MLICEQHKDRNENKELLENYRAKYIANPGSPYRDYSKTIALHADAESDESYIANGEDLKKHFKRTINDKWGWGQKIYLIMGNIKSPSHLSAEKM